MILPNNFSNVDFFIQDCYQESHESSIAGNIYWRFGDSFFPEEGWFDYVSPLLVLWTYSVLELFSHSRNKAVLEFRDGPFQILLNRTSNESLCVICKSNIFPERTILQCNVDEKRFIQKLFLEASRFLDWCKNNINITEDSYTTGELSSIYNNCEYYKVNKRKKHRTYCDCPDSLAKSKKTGTGAKNGENPTETMNDIHRNNFDEG